jgi:hypothetical protein
MIYDQDLPMCLWAEAAMIAVYVQNRLSHSTLGLKTSEEMFTGKKPELDPSRKKGIFVGSPRPSESTYQVTATLRLAGT